MPGWNREEPGRLRGSEEAAAGVRRPSPARDPLRVHAEHQSAKTRLLEVTVPRGRVHQVAITHHDEGDAVGEPPSLVHPALEQLQRASQERCIDRHDDYVRLGVAAPDEGCSELPQPLAPAQRVADLREDGFRDDHLSRSPHEGKESQGAVVVWIAGIEERLDVVGVQEEPSARHRRDQAAEDRFGVP